MSQGFDMVIAGAGIAGATFAAAALRQGIAEPGRIALVDAHFVQPAAPAADLDLRMFALSRASQRLFESIGVWRSLDARHSFAYERMCVWDAQVAPRSSGTLTFDAAELGEPDLGHIVEGRALHSLALRAARAAGAVAIEARIASVQVADAGATLALSDGRVLQATLVVAADGAESPVRRALRIESVGRDYHQRALVAHVKTERPHESTAWQRFMPDGPLALLPLTDGRSSIVWTMESTRAEELRAGEREDFNAALTAASDGVLGACEATTAIGAFPLALSYAQVYAAPHCVLLADAAHSVHPLAGQGLNLGLRDCTALLHVLQAAPMQLGELAVLKRYERSRKSDNLLNAGLFDGLNRLFSTDHAGWTRARGFGLSAVARSPSLRRMFARHALGVT